LGVSIIAQNPEGSALDSQILVAQNLTGSSGGSDNGGGAANNAIYVAWHNNMTSCPADVWFTKSVDGAGSFSTPIDLSNGKTASDRANQPRMAAFGKNLYILWLDQFGRMFFKASINGGGSFGAVTNISNDTGIGYGDYPILAAYGHNVYLSWVSSEYNILFAKSTDEGRTFSLPVNLSSTLPRALNIGLHMAVSENHIYVAWATTPSDSPISSLLLRESTDNGTTFADTITISKPVSSFNGINAQGRNIYLFWQSNVNGYNETVHFSASHDAGKTFGKPVLISKIGITTTIEGTAAYDSNVYIVMHQFVSAKKNGPIIAEPILLKASTDAGNSFSSYPKVLVGDVRGIPSSIFNLQTAAFGSSLYVVSDNTAIENTGSCNGCSGPADYVIDYSGDISIAKSSDSGNTVDSPVKISDGTGASFTPKIAASGDHVYVVWTNDNKGVTNIIFRESQDGGATFGNPVNLSGG
jgi:hypothetical protein